MIPIKDDNPTKNRSYVRVIILALCTIVFILQISSKNFDFYNYYFGFKPASLFTDSNIQSFYPLLTLITSIFMHGGWMHYLGNMIYLWIFADNVEDVMGRTHFVFFYLISGVFATISHSILDINSSTPLIGASGAIAGVLGSYLYLFPKARVLVLFPFIIFFTVRVPAFILLLFWFIYQFINLGDSSNIAWIAHIGGFIFGFIYTVLMIKKKKEKNIKKGKSIFSKDKGPWN